MTYFTLEQQNRTIDELQSETRAGITSQAQSILKLENMVDQLVYLV